MPFAKMLRSFCSTIDNLNEWTAKIGSWLIVPLTLLVVMDVTLRYVFNRPTIWAWDIAVQLLGGIAVLGSGYALLVGAHIGIDVFPQHLSKRKKGVLEIITYTFFFFSVGVLLWKTTLAAVISVQTKEMYNSFFRPPIYFLKVAMFVGFLLLFLEGIANFIRNLLNIISPRAGGTL